ncbi:MAG: hypothetical protein A3K41_05515 [Chloroflexi bacterium RIFOXYD12_FULL_57_15]|nr:MAG: hypothetical protein A3K41_05515 [Chloroflexi bacterium RIFOXYD12_FULL_57_15]
MNTLSPFYSIDRPCDDALKWTQEQLSQAGLRAMRTFDLHTARHALDDCPCPNHGTEECDCQMVVLLVYGKASDVSTPLNTSPAALILHGNDGQTWVSIADNPSQRTDAKLITAIQQALEIKEPVSISQGG